MKFAGYSVALLLFTAALVSPAQQPVTPEQATPAIRVTTRLVLVDVIVADKDGKPITDLKPEDFLLEDNGKKQTISMFGLEQPGAQAPLASLPPNIYSNRPEFNLPPGPLTVLLIDGLNSPFADQARARQELIKYAARQLKTGQRTAVYALGNRLYRIQPFTSDPAVLLAAIESFQPASLPQHGSALSPLPAVSAAAASGGGSSRPAGLMNAAALEASNLQTFQSEQALPALQARIETTLAAMRAIARELSGHSGRKNLVWVSAGFPVSLVPETNTITYVNTRAADPTGPPPLPNEQTFTAYNQGIRQQSADDVRRTAALLADSQVAIYPVDARGLLGATTDASASGTGASGLLMLGTEFAQSVSNQGASLEASQSSMHDLAQETGGRVFINRNDIDHAVAAASSDGGTYYALGYYPEKKKFDGSFHKLKVTLDRPGAQARYRRGYFALDPGKLSNKDKENELATTLRNEAQATQVLFDARVVPPAPAAMMRVPVQFLVRTETFTTEEAPGGGRQLNLDFFVAAFTRDGKPAANLGQTVSTAVTAEQFAQIQQQGLLLPMELTLPPGQYQLRLAVRDNRTGYLGTLTVPLDLSKTGP